MVKDGVLRLALLTIEMREERSAEASSGRLTVAGQAKRHLLPFDRWWPMSPDPQDADIAYSRGGSRWHAARCDPHGVDGRGQPGRGREGRSEIASDGPQLLSSGHLLLTAPTQPRPALRASLGRSTAGRESWSTQSTAPGQPALTGPTVTVSWYVALPLYQPASSVVIISASRFASEPGNAAVK